MKIDIWSDVACPFCYIGKRHLEAALAKFPQREQVEVTWHNFELDPNAKTDYEETQLELLAKKYGMSPEQARANTDRVAQSGKAAGITFDFEKVIPTNTFNAHRLIQFAHKHGVQDQAEEALFKAMFIEGKHIGKKETLQGIAESIGLDAAATAEMLAGTTFTHEVRKDEAEAQGLGIRGVPFFVFDRKYAVSGAQPVDVFTQTLEKVWEETRPADITPGGVCEDGVCN